MKIGKMLQILRSARTLQQLSRASTSTGGTSAHVAHLRSRSRPLQRVCLQRRELLTVFTGVIFATANAAATAMEGLQQSKIIPDLIDRVAVGAQQVEMSVTFGPTVAKDGVLIPPAKAAKAPQVKIIRAPESLFTLIASDPDPPDPANPIRREWMHWLVTNIPDKDVSKGDELVPYMGPAPPIGTHRYVFMLFKQADQEPIKAQDPTHGKRAQFNTRKFAQQYNLGDPVAVTWFNSHK